MLHKIYTLLAFLLFFANGWLAPAQPIAAAESPTVEVTAPGAWVRMGPDFAAPNTVAIFKGERYQILERSADGEWLRLSGGKLQHSDTWLHVSLVTVKSGALANAPIRDCTNQRIPHPNGVFPR